MPSLSSITKSESLGSLDRYTLYLVLLIDLLSLAAVNLYVVCCFFVQAFAIFCGMAIHHTAMYEECQKALARQKVALEVIVDVVLQIYSSLLKL